MLKLTDSTNGNTLYVNPRYVVAVFVVVDDGEHNGKTGISLINGTLIVDEDFDFVVSIAGHNLY